MATVDTLIFPIPFKGKNKDPEQLLIHFDSYMKTVNIFITTGNKREADRTKIAILPAVGGPDMVDLVEMGGKVQLEAVVADAANRVVGVVPGTYKQIVEKIRHCIVGNVEAEALLADGTEQQQFFLFLFFNRTMIYWTFYATVMTRIIKIINNCISCIANLSANPVSLHSGPISLSNDIKLHTLSHLVSLQN